VLPHFRVSKSRQIRFTAVWKGELETVRLLIKKGSNVNVKNNKGETPLHNASNGGHFRIVKLLIEKGSDVNAKAKNGWTPLSEASYKGHLEIVKLLIENKALVNIPDNSVYSPLHNASIAGHLEIAEYLVEKGADVNASHKDGGETPLYFASSNGYIEIVKLLIEHRVDVKTKDKNGWTSLHKAALNGDLETYSEKSVLSYFEILKLLIEKGANVNAKNNKGETPLHLASLHGHLETVKYLIEKGADKETKTLEGETPLDVARELDLNVNSNKVIISILSSKKSGKWSGYMGDMDWENAKTNCANIGMRLPTIEELNTAYAAKITKSWEKDGYDYWSSTPDGEDGANYFSISSGTVYHGSRNHSGFIVRCIR
jgi:ankyrin repeat protein